MRSFSLVLLLAAAAAFAQNQTANPLIPASASSKCQAYMNTLNSDKTMQACIAPLLTATARFQPSTAATANAGDVSWAMDQLCNSSHSCKQSDVQATITAFYSACNDELASGANDSIRTTFDLVYMLIPLRNAVCSKDADGKYCLNKAKSKASASNPDQTTLQIQATNWVSTNLQYLFVGPDDSPDILCTNCTQHILVSYIQFENLVPYPIGISNSLLLRDQKTLWQAIGSKCSTEYLNNILDSANANPQTANAVLSAGNTVRPSLGVAGILGAVMALAAALA